MALIKCKECGSAISTRAEKCPQCGNPQKTSSAGRIFTLLILLLVVALIGIFVLLPFSRFQTAKQECLDMWRRATYNADHVSGSAENQYVQLRDSERQCHEANLMFVNVLTHKPLWLPLTAQERKTLDTAKNSIRNDVAKRIKIALKEYEYDHKGYPEGTKAEIITTLETTIGSLDHPYFIKEGDTQKNANGELIDPFGKPYPMSLDQLEAILPTSEN